ncbi:non-specific lipid transfer protein GPI-anchored 31 isoform X2 [Prosopis cineraria]|uniref:non-specific lipid transfer protein GPI-anchored 31 isoform X2 n=1 Tax=Prosopis cineraria TaxID=364024 RepID=UPI00240EED15|nr:non-specific lipid transfer protein GPI-anchored 31 isoform X2 [Prosopis cineraria]
MAAKTSLILCLVAIWAVALVHGASSSAHHAPSPAPDCSSLITNMVDCLSFVSSGSNTTKPQGSCCSGFKTVLKSNPDCICQAFKSSSQLGVTLNVTKALTLPAACKVSAPDFSSCGLSVTPAAAPAAVPGMSGSGATSEISPTAAPVPSPGNSAPSMVPISAGSLLVCILAAIFFSGF